MGCAGAGAATAISQWVTAIPLLYLLNKSIPFNILGFGGPVNGEKKNVLQAAIDSYYKAGGLILLRTIAKISAYTVTSAAAARLGTVPMAAYSLTFNLGFATSQLCESISVAVQALLARDVPFKTAKKKAAAAHVMNRALLLGFLVSGGLTVATLLNQSGVLNQLTKTPEVFAAASAIMPVVLATQIFKGLAYSTGGILLGGLDWLWSTFSMVAASAVCMALITILPHSLWNVWVALAAFMATQVFISSIRFLSRKGPWTDVYILGSSAPETTL
jgi:Na+-driven multidrug efflux pump